MRLLALLLLTSLSYAGELAGVTMPDSVQVGGQNLVLNGLGLREKFWIDIYVGGLYLPARTTDANRAIHDDVAKRIEMRFIYSRVTRQQMIDSFREGLAKNPNGAAFAGEMAQLESFMEDCMSGDVVTIDYVPGTGTRFVVRGRDKGTIPGKAFMEAIWEIYLGANPPTTKLKSGMLGGS